MCNCCLEDFGVCFCKSYTMWAMLMVKIWRFWIDWLYFQFLSAPQTVRVHVQTSADMRGYETWYYSGGTNCTFRWVCFHWTTWWGATSVNIWPYAAKNAFSIGGERLRRKQSVKPIRFWCIIQSIKTWQPKIIQWREDFVQMRLFS